MTSGDSIFNPGNWKWGVKGWAFMLLWAAASVVTYPFRKASEMVKKKEDDHGREESDL